MNIILEKLINRLVSHNNLPELSSINRVTQSPVDSSRLCLDIDVVIEHRFVFPCWCRFNRKTYKEDGYAALRKPILVAIDWHDDIGLEGDYDNGDLDLLDTDDKLSAGLFTWGVLRRLNDGHIYPALYHDLFSDVYVLLKQDNGYDKVNSGMPDKSFSDKNGLLHNVLIFNEPDALALRLRKDSDRYFFLDIDMDYFTLDANSKRPTILSEEDVKKFCDFSNPIFGHLKDRLVGVTIALEPDYCCGLENSLRLYGLFNKGILSFYGRN